VLASPYQGCVSFLAALGKDPGRAHVLGFTTITARGFDVARVQVQRARLLARDLCGISGVNLTFDVADVTGELPEA
jgi:hypothetical protein